MSLVAQLQRRPFRSGPHTQRWRPPRRRRARLKIPRWIIAVLLGMVAMSIAAVAAWILAGGNQVGLPAPLSDWLPPTTPLDAGVEKCAVHVASTPSGRGADRRHSARPDTSISRPVARAVMY